MPTHTDERNLILRNIGTLYDSTMHVGAIPSFVVLYTQKLKLGIVSGDKAMNLAVLYGDFQIIFFFFSA